MYDIIIIGGASAGLTAALYASRQGSDTLVITKDIGGQANMTDRIANYPGFDAIGGPELMNKFQEQAENFGTEFVYDEATGVEELEPGCFTVKTSSQEYEGCTVILAFGKTPRDLGVPGEEEYKGRGISYCAICDGPLFREKKVAVVGSGDPALDAAVYLEDLASETYLVHRMDKPTGKEETIQRLKNDGVDFVANSKVTSINGSSTVTSISVEDTDTHEEKEVEVDGVFIEMGYVAKTDFVKDLVDVTSRNEIVIDENCATSHPGVFAAGDVTTVPFKQIAVSAGQGCIASLSAYNYLRERRGKSRVRVDWT